MTELIAIQDIKDIANQHIEAPQVEALDRQFQEISIYELKIGILCEKLSDSKAISFMKALVTYISSINEDAKVLGSKRHPSDFDMEMYMFSIEVNLMED